jgi:SHS2 domain-containing protein
MKDFEVLPHTADLKIRAYGSTLKELFNNALKGMFTSIHPLTSLCSYVHDRLVCAALPQQHSIEVTAPDLESLLVNFLSEALYLSDANDEAYLQADIEDLTDQHIKAIIYGVAVEGFEVVEIKAVTYHDLKIEKIDGLWQTDIVFDI